VVQGCEPLPSRLGVCKTKGVVGPYGREGDVRVDGREEDGWDPFAMGGYVEEDQIVEDWKVFMAQRVPKSERQKSLFQFVLDAIERRKGDGRS
jgi:hypothetical protein